MTAPRLLTRPRPTRPSGPARTLHRATAAVLAVPLALVLAACGGSTDGMSSAAGGSSSAERQLDAGAPDADGGDGRAAESDPGSGADTAGRAATLTRKVVYRGQVEVRVRDVARSADRVEAIVLGVGGLVSSEESYGSAGPASPRSVGTSEARLTVRVPPESFRRVLTRIGGLGTELSRSQTAKDVTTQVVDVASRVESQQRSVARVRTLLAEATDIGEIVAIESELARREADLDSLKAQLATLEDTTDLATIEVGLVERTPKPPVDPEDDDLGFLTGLRGGWDALAGLVLIASTAAGAALPFLLALSVPALGAALALRRRRPVPAQPAETS